MKFDELIEQKKGIEKVALIIGLGCFIGIVVLVIINLGFSMEIHKNINTQDVFYSELSWVISLGLGLIGGILLDYKHILISAIIGSSSGISLYFSTDLYLNWRDEFLYIELILPMLLVSVGGVKIHQFILTKLNN